MTADRLTPQREAERVQGILYEAITAFQNVAHLSSLQHAQMRDYLAEHLAPTLLAELTALRAERDRYRTAWQSARFRAQAYSEGIIRHVADRDTWMSWCKQAEAARDEARMQLAAVGAERDEARTAALNEAADWFDGLADREPSQGYRAQVMRGAANDIRRLISAEAGESR